MCNYKQVLLYTRKIDKAVNASDPKKRKQKKTLQTSYRMFNLLQPIHPIPRLNNAARVLNKKRLHSHFHLLAFPERPRAASEILQILGKTHFST